MAYTRTYTLVPTPGGDTVKAAIATKLDGDLTNIFTHLNTHEALTATHGATGAVVGTTNSQVLTNKTLTSPTINSGVLTTPQINDTSSDHQYVFAVSELAADRTVTLPLLTGNDEFVFKDFTQTLTNKTLTSPTVNAATVSGTVTTVAGISVAGQYVSATKTLTSGATVAINWNDGNVQVLTLDHSGITITFANPKDGGRYVLIIIQGAGGSKTVTTWPTMEWLDGAAPTLSTTAARADVIGIIYAGTTYYGIPTLGVY